MTKKLKPSGLELIVETMEYQPLEKNFKWPKYKIKALGFWFSIDPQATATLNCNEKLDKDRNVLSC